jgi:hypothetical protein
VSWYGLISHSDLRIKAEKILELREIPETPF